MLLLQYLLQAFSELADEFALLSARSLSDDGDEASNHHERKVNAVEDESATDNTEDADAAEEEIVELDTIGDFEKMSHGRGFITLQVTHNLTRRCCVYFQLSLLLHENQVKLQCHLINCILFGSDYLVCIFLHIRS